MTAPTTPPQPADAATDAQIAAYLAEEVDGLCALLSHRPDYRFIIYLLHMAQHEAWKIAREDAVGERKSARRMR